MAGESIFLQGASFDKTKAFQELKKLAQNPLDLTKEGALTPKRIESMKAEGAGFTLLYGFERVTEQVMDTLFRLAEERSALKQMQAMQAGEMANFIEGFESERRSVLHTAMRDVFDHPNQGNEAKKAAELEKKELEKLKKFIDKIDKENKFSDLILIGIGGSELGPKALYYGLSFYHKKGRKVHFIGNVDPDDVELTLREVNLAKAVVVVISKSGTTIETATNEAFLRKEYEKLGLNPKEHFVSVTMPKSPMDNKENYLECFHIYDFVGGRYSATSMVGGPMLAFGVGYNEFVELLRGAHDMDKVSLRDNPKENLPLLAALLGIWNHNFLGHQTVAIIPYAQVLHRFPAHLQQCDMESNGKHIDRRGKEVSFETGPIIWGEPGTNAQHSFYQLIHQGTQVVPVELIGFVQQQSGRDFAFRETRSQEKLTSNLFAQAIALATGQKNENPNKFFKGNRPCSILLGKRLTPYELGALLSYYENKVAFQGFIWQINSFDQEGVQLGKVLANRVLKLYEARHNKKQAEAFPLGDELLKIADKISK